MKWNPSKAFLPSLPNESSKGDSSITLHNGNSHEADPLFGRFFFFFFKGWLA